MQDFAAWNAEAQKRQRSREMCATENVPDFEVRGAEAQKRERMPAQCASILLTFCITYLISVHYTPPTKNLRVGMQEIALILKQFIPFKSVNNR